jgi:predicted RND superfamily exporter protein
MGIRDRIERSFEGWGRRLSANPWTVLVCTLVFVATCMGGLPRLTVDVSFEAFLHADDPVRVTYDAFREQFGRDERVIVSVERGTEGRREGDVFDIEFLARLRDLHESIESRVPYVDDVTSLVNARDTRGEGDTLVVEDFLDPWPRDDAELAVLRDRAIANPLFRNNVISSDAQTTTIMLELQLYTSAMSENDDLEGFDSNDAESDEPPPLLSSGETAELVHALKTVLSEFEGPDFVLHIAGSPVMLNDVSGSMLRDMPRFAALAIATIAGFLFLLFRRFVAVVTPLVVVILSVLSTFGLMGWSGTSIHVPTQILPSFLLAVGVGDAVHLLAIFYENLRKGETREDALAHALGHSGLALVLTSVTTAAGLASFATAGLAPVAALGLFAPIGVMVALALSLTLLPAMIQILPLRLPRQQTESDGLNRLDRVLVGFGRFATRNPNPIIATSALLLVLAGISASFLTLSHDPLSWLDEETEIVQGTRHIDHALGGSVSFEILVTSEEPNGVRQPDVLSQMALLGASYETLRRDDLVAAQTTSLADVVKEINRALNEDREEAYTIPDDAALISQELLLFENTGTDDLEEMVDSGYRTARISARMPWRDAVRYRSYLDMVETEAQSMLGSHGQVSMTGVMPLLVRSTSAVVTSIARSYVLAFAIITPLMILLLGNLRLGLLAMIPNLAPIILALGLMGIAGLPLDAFSLLFGGIALGLAVDDTIHFMHNYRRYREDGQDCETAVTTTLLSTGRAMLITTIVLSTGFLGFVLTSMHNLTNLGILVSFAIVVAFFADVLLAPALLAALDRRSSRD